MNLAKKYRFLKVVLSIVFALVLTQFNTKVFGTIYFVSTKIELQSRMNIAMPGDEVIVRNGVYNWDFISFNNTKGSSTSAWITLRAETFNGVVFQGTTYLQFAGKKLLINGFKFANGNVGDKDIIQFRNQLAGTSASYCRLTNITIENYSSDSSGTVNGTDIDNKWVSIYGVRNRVDHCTFINKYNAGATLVVWYDNSNYPQQSTPTFHRIDSNYFRGRSYLGGNGGETLRIGVSTASRTFGYNIIERNLFEGMTQTEPEIISNKSSANTYRYNTFKNASGGLTFRQGRFCIAYSNFFIVDDPSVTRAYGIRIIDKGHKVFNNYFEGLNGNENTFSTPRSPISLYNGLYSANDTSNPTYASTYFPGDSCTIAFNTIVNCKGGGGIVLGYTDAGLNVYQPLGITVANNLIKMTTGQAVYIPPTNNLLTYAGEGNIYNAPNGLGLASSSGFKNTPLNFGSMSNGILLPPSLVQDSAVNSANYTTLLNGLDAQGFTRSATYDVGCTELNGSGTIIASPLDSNEVGAGKPVKTLPVHLLSFKTLLVNRVTNIDWTVTNEQNFKAYNIEWSVDAERYQSIGMIASKGISSGPVNYNFQHNNTAIGSNYYRLKMIDKDGTFQYSNVRLVNVVKNISLSIYPNPAQQYLTIDLNGTLQPQTEVIMTDPNGKEIKRLKLVGNTVNISLQNLLPGLYLIKLFENGRSISNHPIIVGSK